MSAVASDPMFVVPDPFRPVYSDSPPPLPYDRRPHSEILDDATARLRRNGVASGGYWRSSDGRHLSVDDDVSDALTCMLGASVPLHPDGIPKISECSQMLRTTPPEVVAGRWMPRRATSCGTASRTHRASPIPGPTRSASAESTTGSQRTATQTPCRTSWTAPTDTSTLTAIPGDANALEACARGFAVQSRCLPIGPPSPCLRVHIPNATIPTAAAPLPATSWSSMGTRMPTMAPCICIRRQAAPALIGGVLMAHMGGE